MRVPASSSSQSLPDDLTTYGWNPGVADAYEPHGGPGRLPGRVVRVDRGACLTVLGGVGLVPCHHRDLTERGVGPPATGDWVAVEHVAGWGHRVAAIVDRRTALRRAGPDGEEEVIAANIDAALVVHGLDRQVRKGRLERTLVAVWDGGARPVIVLTKADIVAPGDVAAAIEKVRAVAGGAPVVAVSNVTGEGLAAVAAHAGPGSTIAMIGESGVGKSTLLNRLAGETLQATAATRPGDGKGRHTTTARELVPLASGAVLIDTPGLRSLALWEGERGRATAFSEIEDLAGGCRFRDCRHDSEPGCAVRDAIATGGLPAGRLASYRKLGREQESQARRAEARRRRAESRAGRRTADGRAGRRRARPDDRWD